MACDPSLINLKPIIDPGFVKYLSDAKSSFPESYVNLEELLMDQCFSDFVIEEFLGSNNELLQSYLAPNEKPPYSISIQLYQMSPGIIVSVGTERSFFDLLLSDPSKFKGLVIRDINPLVKCYMDFAKCLIYIAKDREDFCRLAKKPESSIEQSSRISEIKQLLQSSPLPINVREYYERHLTSFAEIYYSTPKMWTESPEFEEVNYFKNDFLFEKLQKAVKAGAVITSIGDINDLSFLQNHEIAVVDTSNVGEYFPIRLEGLNKLYPSPLIIWTKMKVTVYNTQYFSYTHPRFTSEEDAEYSQYYSKIISTIPGDKSSVFSNFLKKLRTSDSQFVPGLIGSYTYETLKKMKQYFEEYIYEFPEYGCVDFNNCGNSLEMIPKHILLNAFSDPVFVEKFVNSGLCFPSKYGFIPIKFFALFEKYYRSIDLHLLLGKIREKIKTLTPQVLNKLKATLQQNLSPDTFEYLGLEEILSNNT